MKCARHPNIETNLTCGKCGTPICPKCLVQTPVGARCPDCAGLRRLPTFAVQPSHLIKAVGVGLGLAVITGVVWYAIGSAVPFLSLLMALPAAYVIGELVSLSVNRKRGRPLQVIAACSFVLSYLVAGALPQVLTLAAVGAPLGGDVLLQIAGRTILGNLLNLYGLIFMAIGVIIAASRL
ncbi:MAG: B-box zinc finger protein [Chloroflexota bacterium]